MGFLRVFFFGILLFPFLASAYTDVSPSSPYAPALTQLTTQGIVTGYPDGYFRPRIALSRAEATAIVLRALALRQEVPQGTTTFSDVEEGSWYAPYIAQGKFLGIVQGFPDGTFRPEQSVTRSELLSLLFRTFLFLEVTPVSESPYLDVPSSSWMAPYAALNVRYALLSAPFQLLFPHEEVTRGDTALALFTLLSHLPEAPSPNPNPTPIPNPTTGKAEWTILVYMNADNNLEPFGLQDLNEMEMVGSSSRVQIIVQADRHPGYATGSGDWTGAKRFRIEKDSDTTLVTSPVLEDLGEVDMGNNATLLSFLEYGVKKYPAEHYGVILWNHGAGFMGSSVDESSYNSAISSLEFEDMWKKYTAKKLPRITLLAFDMCLMGQFELDYLLSRYVDIRVGSEELVSVQGFPYQLLLAPFTTKSLTPEQFAEHMVESFDEYYQGRGNRDRTLSAIDLRRFAPLFRAFQQYAEELTLLDSRELARVLQARSITDSFAQNETDSEFGYIDLGDFLENILAVSTSRSLKNSTRSLLAELNAVVLHEAHGENHPNVRGISLYFPEGGNVRSDYLTLGVAKDTRWDEFLRMDRLTRASYTHMPTVRLGKTEAPYFLTEDEELTLSATLTGPISRAGAFIGYEDPAHGEIVLLSYQDLPVTTSLLEQTVNATFSPHLPSVTDGKKSYPLPLFAHHNLDREVQAISSQHSILGNQLSTISVFDQDTGSLSRVRSFYDRERILLQEFTPYSGEQVVFYHFALPLSKSSDAEEDATLTPSYRPLPPLFVDGDNIRLTTTHLSSGSYVYGFLAYGTTDTIIASDYVSVVQTEGSKFFSPRTAKRVENRRTLSAQSLFDTTIPLLNPEKESYEEQEALNRVWGNFVEELGE